MQVHFYVREGEGGKATVYIDCHWDGQRIQKTTKVKILSKSWSVKQKDGAYINSGEQGAREKNAFLLSLKNRVTALYLNHRPGVPLSPEEVSEAINPPKPALAPAPVKRVPTPAEVLADWKARNKHKKSKDYLRKYDQVVGHLASYAPALDMDGINERFIEDYTGYLLDEVDSIQSNNTISRHVKFFRLVLKESSREFEWVKDEWYRNPDRAALTWEEFGHLAAAKMPAQYLAEVRDGGCLMGYTGLRYSDASRLQPVDVLRDQDGPYVLRHMQKTKKPVRIPLTTHAVELLERYHGQYDTCLPFYSNQKMNEYLKLVGRYADLDRQVKHIRYRGNQRIEVVEPVKDLLSCHMFRHTFATISLNRGMDHLVLADIMGVSLQTVSIYAKVLEPTKRIQMDRVWLGD